MLSLRKHLTKTYNKMSVLSTSNNELKYAGFDKNGELTFVTRHELNLIHFPLFSEDDGEDMTEQDSSLNTQTTTENKLFN